MSEMTLTGSDKLMWVVDGVPVATAVRREVLEALGGRLIPDGYWAEALVPRTACGQ